MLLRLFALPTFFLLLSFVGLYFLGDFIPHRLSGSAVLEGLASGSRTAAPLVGAALLLAAMVLFAVNFYRLWCWNRGKSDCCFTCGGMVEQKHGRYGPYKRCLACGNKQKI
jgi:hypothetical protein